MRILFITQIPLDEASGRARHVLALARAFAGCQHAVTVAAPGYEDPSRAISRIRPAAALGPGLRMEAALAAVAAFASRRTDIAYVRLSASSSLVPAILASLRVPFVVELNGPVVDELRQRGRTLAASLARVSLRRAISLSEHLIAVDATTAWHARSVLRAGNVSIVENGADIDAASLGSRAAARARLGLPQTAQVVTFAGTLAPEQRLDLLLEAHRQMDGVTLLVAGGGAQAALLHSAVASARACSPVIAMGVVSHTEAILAQQAADVCVDLREDRLGLKCLEYAAIGRRILTWNVDGIERLEGLYPGLEAVHPIEERSASAVRRGLQAALESEARRGPLLPDAVRDARARLGWEHSARRIIAVLERCV